jgi:hypothetical protein
MGNRSRRRCRLLGAGVPLAAFLVSVTGNGGCLRVRPPLVARHRRIIGDGCCDTGSRGFWGGGPADGHRR